VLPLVAITFQLVWSAPASACGLLGELDPVAFLDQLAGVSP